MSISHYPHYILHSTFYYLLRQLSKICDKILRVCSFLMSNVLCWKANPFMLLPVGCPVKLQEDSDRLCPKTQRSGLSAWDLH